MGIKLHQHTRDDEMTAKGYIRVDKTVNNREYFEGDAGFTLNNNLLGKTYFYVMQWQAKQSGSVPISTGSGLPWVNISQIQAIAASQLIGTGYHLITNDEWMAIARDVENVAINWTGGSVGSGVLKRGNVGDTATGDYNGADPEAGVTNSLATLYLSNGQTIWDIAGNVWKWVDYSILTTEMPTPRTGWLEFNQITNWSTNLGYDNVGPKDNSRTGSNGVGRIYADPDTSYSNNTPYDNTVHAFLRGGYWGAGADAGAFALILSLSPAYTGASVGFRCAR